MADVQIGEPEIDDTPAAEPAPVQAAPAPEADPVAQQFTWEGGGQDPGTAPTPASSWQPSQWSDFIDHGQDGSALEMPDAGKGSAAYPTVQKSGASGKGITDHGITQTQKLTGFAGVDQKTDAAMAPLAQLMDTARGNYKAANDEMSDAISTRLQAEQLHHGLLQDLDSRIADFTTTARHVEEQATLHSQQERQQYLTQYQTQLAGVRQMMAQDANPLHNMSGGAKMALGAAQFAQGFLASRGIQIDVSGQVDKWVDRELQEHQQNIKNARDAAGDTLTMYGLARQASSDDAEARMKLRGFVIEGLKQRIQVEADRFGSDLAVASAKEKIATLDREQAATTERLGSAFFNARQETRKAYVEEAYKQGMLSIEQYKAEIEALKARAMASKAQKGTGRMLVKDPEQQYQGPDGKMVNAVPTNPKTGQPLPGYKQVDVSRWEIDPTLPDGVKSKVAENADKATNDWRDYHNSMTNVLKLRDKVHQEMEDNKKDGLLGKFGDAMGYTSENLRRRQSPSYDAYRAALDRMSAAELRVETGVSANKDEIERKRAEYPDERILSSHDGRALFTMAQEQARQKFEGRMKGIGIVPVEDGDPEKYRVGTEASPGTAANYRVENSPTADTSYVAQEAGKAERGSDEQVSAGKQAGVFKHFQAQASGGGQSVSYANPHLAGGNDGNPGNQAQKPNEVPEFAQHMNMLAIAAIQPDAVGKDVEPGEAVEALKRLASNDKLTGERSAYAGWLLTRIENDPDGLLKEINGSK